MATRLDPVVWEKTLSLNRQNPSPLSSLHILDIPRTSFSLEYPKSSHFISKAPSKNSSILHSQRLKQSLLESRKAFFNLPVDEVATPKELLSEKSGVRGDTSNNYYENDHRKVPAKKISFKVKKVSSVCRRNHNKVTELTLKFNEMILEKNSAKAHPKFRKLLNRGNCHKDSSTDPEKIPKKPNAIPRDFSSPVSRKPSVKTKPAINFENRKLVIVKRKPTVKRKFVTNKNVQDSKTAIDSKMYARAKTGRLETSQTIEKTVEGVSGPELEAKPKPSLTAGTVQAAIEIFERRTSESSPVSILSSNNSVPKSKVLEKKENLIGSNKEIAKQSNQNKTEFLEQPVIGDTKTDSEADAVEIVDVPAQRRCDSMYETLNPKKIVSPPTLKSSKSEEVMLATKIEKEAMVVKPNASFLWSFNQDRSPSTPDNPISNVTGTVSDSKTLNDLVDSKTKRCEEGAKTARPKTVPSLKSSTLKSDFTKTERPQPEDKIYEELNVSREEDAVSHDYEYCGCGQELLTAEAPDTDDGYEYCDAAKKENIYEALVVPSVLPRRQDPLPPRPSFRSGYCTQNSEVVSNCYESIYNSGVVKADVESTYESIYGCQMPRDGSGSNRDSLVSSDQQSNSLYGRTSFAGWRDDGNATYSGKASSDLSASDRSDDWVDVTDNEDIDNYNSGIIIIRDRQKCKRIPGWSQQLREQWSKSPRNMLRDKGIDSDSDHHYESLYNASKVEYQDDDYDSFESDSESEPSFQKINLNDSGVDIGSSQLPELPSNPTYGFTKLAASAGKHMKKFKNHWSITKNDITKSLSRMTKRKSRTGIEITGSSNRDFASSTSTGGCETADQENSTNHKNVELDERQSNHPSETEKTRSLSRRGFFQKFRRSMSLSAESAWELTSSLDNKPKSTFYLTENIDIDNNDETNNDSGTYSLLPIPKKTNLARPRSPPPPAPQESKTIIEPDARKTNKKTTSWYTEVGLFKNAETNQNTVRRPNTFWYAEVGLYETSQSSPSASSAENSGNNLNVSAKTDDFVATGASEEYYNLKNESNYCNSRVESLSSTRTEKDPLPASLTLDKQLRLQYEPLYQFYNAAVLESVCNDGTSDLDSDGYEEIECDVTSPSRLSMRPSAMELVSPDRNSLPFSRTLWCEIPEVIQSSVLSSLSVPQKKLQEAKFEMITSEASYLNSLKVLTDHFIASFETCNLVTPEERSILFGKVSAVKNCSEKLLFDLEKCWQDNILLHSICDIVQKNAESDFGVYVSYCENQILLDDTLKKLKEKPGFLDILRNLESRSACQSLTLHSFLMLPMQRITRWPLLVDAVLKRLSPQDPEYLTCQCALATINKIVHQCNESARRKERENEMKKISAQLEFGKGVPRLEIVTENRWLIRSGTVTHIQQKTDDAKLTFGKRFNKSTLNLVLFNDLLFVTKPKSESLYMVIHYCPRNLIELSTMNMQLSLPLKDHQDRHLLFLTLLENQNEKTVEFLVSCNSESDKERWIEALAAPKSEDSDETLYERWDCPQVTAVHDYLSSQPDELALNRGDVVNVLKKMTDGWYHGERVRDGQIGWFPANYTVQIANPHVRSRNLKQRYRLLAFSENYLKSK